MTPSSASTRPARDRRAPGPRIGFGPIGTFGAGIGAPLLALALGLSLLAVSRCRPEALRMMTVAGPVVALIAILVGLLLAANIAVAWDEAWVKLVIVLAGVAAIAGGALYLVGVHAATHRRPVVLRALGWAFYTAAFVLPTSLGLYLLVASALTLPSVFLDDPVHWP